MLFRSDAELRLFYAARRILNEKLDGKPIALKAWKQEYAQLKTEYKEITEKYPVNLPQVLDRSYESDIINQKYDFIGEIIGEVLLHKERQDLLTERADKLLTSKVWSIPIFLGIMAVTFFLTFTIGDWIKGYFELGINTDTGEAAEGAVRADLTVTFDSCKPLHTAPSSAPFCGEIVCADIGIRDEWHPAGLAQL